jgi:hypothetical protein
MSIGEPHVYLRLLLTLRFEERKYRSKIKGFLCEHIAGNCKEFVVSYRISRRDELGGFTTGNSDGRVGRLERIPHHSTR